MEMDAHKLVERLHSLGELERKVLSEILHRKPVSRNANECHDVTSTFGQRVADRVAAFGGSWTFIILFVIVMVAWMIYNLVSPQKFDVFPFIFLNLVLSCLAALQAPVIMMSQNRQSDKDRLNAQLDYQVNLKSEMEVMALHAKVDELRERNLNELIDLQKRQVELLERLEARLAQEK
jgi:uncharacterized membrane protein